MLAPLRVTVPVPVLVSAPVPARTVLMVPDWVAKVPDDDNVPFDTVAPLSVMVPVRVCVVVPRSSVPPVRLSAPAAFPSVPDPDRDNVPAERFVAPE